MSKIKFQNVSNFDGLDLSNIDLALPSILNSKAKINATTIWSNSNSTSEFSPQEISLDLSAYQYILVLIRVSTSGNSFVPRLLTGGARTICSSVSAGKIVYRVMTFYTNRLNVENGKIFNSYGSSMTNDDSYMIPYQIIGIK